MSQATRRRLIATALIALIVPLGFALKGLRFAPGSQWRPVSNYMNNSSAGVAYEVFWCLVIFLIVPRRRAIMPICVGVFLTTTALEFFQFYQPGPDHPLTEARTTFLGKAMLGNSFAWSDIPHYAVGCALGYLILRAVVRHAESECHAVRDPRNAHDQKHGPVA